MWNVVKKGKEKKKYINQYFYIIRFTVFPSVQCVFPIQICFLRVSKNTTAECDGKRQDFRFLIDQNFNDNRKVFEKKKTEIFRNYKLNTENVFTI